MRHPSATSVDHTGPLAHQMASFDALFCTSSSQLHSASQQQRQQLQTVAAATEKSDQQLKPMSIQMQPSGGGGSKSPGAGKVVLAAIVHYDSLAGNCCDDKQGGGEEQQRQGSRVDDLAESVAEKDANWQRGSVNGSREGKLEKFESERKSCRVGESKSGASGRSAFSSLFNSNKTKKKHNNNNNNNNKRDADQDLSDLCSSKQIGVSPRAESNQFVAKASTSCAAANSKREEAAEANGNQEQRQKSNRSKFSRLFSLNKQQRRHHHQSAPMKLEDMTKRKHQQASSAQQDTLVDNNSNSNSPAVGDVESSAIATWSKMCNNLNCSQTSSTSFLSPFMDSNEHQLQHQFGPSSQGSAASNEQQVIEFKFDLIVDDHEDDGGEGEGERNGSAQEKVAPHDDDDLAKRVGGERQQQQQACRAQTARLAQTFDSQPATGECPSVALASSLSSSAIDLGGSLAPAASNYATGACHQPPVAPRVAGAGGARRRLLDNVNELVESFCLDSQDVCLLSTGKPELNSNETTTTPTNKSRLISSDDPATQLGGGTRALEFDYVFQLARQTLAYCFELLAVIGQLGEKKPSTSSNKTTRHEDQNRPETNLDCDANDNNYEQQQQQSPAGYSIQLGAMLFRQSDNLMMQPDYYAEATLQHNNNTAQQPSEWFEVIDLISCNEQCAQLAATSTAVAAAVSSCSSENDDNLDSGGGQARTMDCSSLAQASECLEQIQLLVENLLKTDHANHRANNNINNRNKPINSNKKRSSLVISFKLNQLINGGLFGNRMCLIDFDPNLIELQCIFESIFNGQALAHLKRRKVHLEQIELELSKLIGSNCSSNELEKQHHHVASMKKLTRAEWFLYKQLGSASIKTLIIVHVHKLAAVVATTETSTGASGQQHKLRSDEQMLLIKQSIEQSLLDYNLNLLEFARLIQKGALTRLRRQKKHLSLMSNHLLQQQQQATTSAAGSNLSISSLSNLSTTSTTATAPIDHNHRHRQPSHQTNSSRYNLRPQQATMGDDPAIDSSCATPTPPATRTMGRKYSLDDYASTRYATRLLDGHRSASISAARRNNNDISSSSSSLPKHHRRHPRSCCSRTNIRLDDDQLEDELESDDDHEICVHHHCSHSHGSGSRANQRRPHHHNNHHKHHHSHHNHRRHQRQSRWRRHHHLSSLDCHQLATGDDQTAAAAASSDQNTRNHNLRRHHSLVRDRDSSGGDSLSAATTLRYKSFKYSHNNNSNNNKLLSPTISQQQQQSDDSDSLASANLNSCSSAASNTCITSQRTAASQRARQMLELRRRMSKQTRQLMMMQQNRNESPQIDDVLRSLTLTSSASSEKIGQVINQITANTVATLEGSQFVDLDDACSTIVVAEPPKQLKLEQFLHQLSNIIGSAPPPTTTTTKATTCACNGRKNGDLKCLTTPISHEQHCSKSNAKLMATASEQHPELDNDHADDDHDDEDEDEDEEEDCKSHSSILNHLASLANESNFKLQRQQEQQFQSDRLDKRPAPEETGDSLESNEHHQPQIGGHLQRILNRTTSTSPRHQQQQQQQKQMNTRAIHQSVRHDEMLGSGHLPLGHSPPSRLSNNVAQQQYGASSVEEKLRALTIDCLPSIASIKTNSSGAATNLTSSNSIDSSCCSSSGSSDSSNDMMIMQPPPPPPPPPLEADSRTSLYASIIKQRQQRKSAACRGGGGAGGANVLAQ